MAFIVKDENGNVVLNVRFDDIPKFVEQNPECEHARLMKQSYENWQNRNLEPCYDGLPPDDSSLKAVIQLKRNIDDWFWSEQENIDFIRRQGIINVNRYKDLPKKYYGVALVPVTSKDLFNNPWSFEYEHIGLRHDVFVNDENKYKRVAIRRRCLEDEPAWLDVKKHDGVEVPDNADELLNKIVEQRILKANK